ncbi:biotin--[acetyl-CoA-carboxylase] ligase [Elioraea sp.]|uniref:biotin--[acetyl-CoA-carboxylase] ligase n=1 Tax=Elioraea sp. TaxID=2185103 RepID=UPI0025B7D040|nr:biotin--[acetyl-CoA-carboxylase] ligase [Elioraea sp.]
MTSIAPARWRVERHESLTSTNDRAIAAAEAGEPPGLVVLAREQTQGRGRSGRVWHSPRGNLFCSILLPPDDALRGGAAALLSGLAAHDAIAGLVPPPHRLALKWPNDLLVGAAKLGGILTEGGTTQAGRSWLVAGIGLNLAHHPDGLDRPVTSLPALGATAADPGMVADRLAAAFAARLALLAGGGMAAIIAAWSARAIAPGTALAVNAASGRLAGRFAGIDHDGALLLATDAGTRRVVAGEVFAEV